MAEKFVKLDDVIDTLENEWGYDGMREDLQNLPAADVLKVEILEAEIATARAEAIKEFAYRLKKEFEDPSGTLYEQVLVRYNIDNLVKEMTEETVTK